jgi:hypothetical protein
VQSISEPLGCLVPNAQKSGGPTAKTIDVSVSAPDVAGILRGRPQDQDTLASSWGKNMQRDLHANGRSGGREGRAACVPWRPKGYIDNGEWVKKQ